jgi:hypothetical protein
LDLKERSVSQEFSDVEYRRLVEEKAEMLEDLRKRKPGQKNYKRSLKAFLEADAKTQKALIERIEREPRHFAADSSTDA